MAYITSFTHDVLHDMPVDCCTSVEWSDTVIKKEEYSIKCILRVFCALFFLFCSQNSLKLPHKRVAEHAHDLLIARAERTAYFCDPKTDGAGWADWQTAHSIVQ